MNKSYAYVYSTGRDDGYLFAVGSRQDGELNGGRALFTTLADAELFARALSSDVAVLPSAITASWKA